MPYVIKVKFITMCSPAADHTLGSLICGLQHGGHHIQHIWDSASRAADRRLIGPHRSSLTDNWNIMNGISLVQRPSKSIKHSLT